MEQTGDVRARFLVRVREAHEAARLIEALLATLPDGEVCTPPGAFPAGARPGLDRVAAWGARALAASGPRHG